MSKMSNCPYCHGGETEEEICPLCENPSGAEEQLDVLPIGLMLENRYYIGKVLGRGGFGITYIGFDTRLELIVAIKEFYPDGFAYREKNENSNTVHPLPGNKRAVYEKSMERFKQEAKSLAKFSREPGVVNVTDYFSAYDTYYIVMEFIDGDKLDTVLKSVGRISEETTLEIFLPVIKILGKMHKAGIIHRDISPNNIMLERETGQPRLIDFGAASRYDVNDGSSTMATQTPGFTPEEVMRGERGRQGAWTDVYSLCATMYTVLEGKKLPDPMSRLLETEQITMSEDISETTRRALENGLIVAHNKRTQSMEQLLSELQSTEYRVQNTEIVITPKTEPVKPETPKLPPAKTYTYCPPCYEGMELCEQIDYHDNGKIIACSHAAGGTYAGFVIEYTPDECIAVTYPTKEVDGKSPSLFVVFEDSHFSYAGIAELSDGKLSGEFCELMNYSSPRRFWVTYRDGERIGTAYRFDGADMLIGINDEEPYLVPKQDGDIWALDEEAHLIFKNGEDYSGFLLNGVRQYFGYEKTDEASYRGQFVNDKKTGLGITCHKSGDVFIGLYNENTEVYGLYYSSEAKKSYFVKNVNNRALTAIGELKGMNIDFKKLFNESKGK